MDGLSRLAYLIGGAGGIVVLIVLIVLDVFLRYLFNRPIASSYEIVMFLMVLVVATALGFCETQKGHVQIELLYNRLPRWMQRIADTLNSLIIAALFFLMAQQNVVRALDIRVEGLTSAILHIPVYPFYLVVAVGCAIVGLVLAVTAVDSLVTREE